MTYKGRTEDATVPPYNQDIPFTAADYLAGFRLALPEPQAQKAAFECERMPTTVSALNLAEATEKGLRVGAFGAGGGWGWEPDDDVLVLISLASPELFSKVMRYLERRWEIFTKGLVAAGLSRLAAPQQQSARKAIDKDVARRVEAMKSDWFKRREATRIRLGLSNP